MKGVSKNNRRRARGKRFVLRFLPFLLKPKSTDASTPADHHHHHHHHPMSGDDGSSSDCSSASHHSNVTQQPPLVVAPLHDTSSSSPASTIPVLAVPTNHTKTNRLDLLPPPASVDTDVTDDEEASVSGPASATTLPTRLPTHQEKQESISTSTTARSNVPQQLPEKRQPSTKVPCFQSLRFSYLTVLLVIYLADGLQGTHLYKLYDEYGFSVSSLYSLGFFTGGILSPITGPWVDQVGRKRAALVYCALEILINTIEQFPNIWCLIGSRMLGGFTTNLLQCVFETWLDSEFRQRQEQQLRELELQSTTTPAAKQELIQAQQEAYELLMRDAVIISNSAAIGSGFLSHILSEISGPVGPFRGAVVCTMIALVVVAGMWTENYGGNNQPTTTDPSTPQNGETPLPTNSLNDDDDEPQIIQSQSILSFLREAARAFMADMRMLRVGIVQGLSVGSLQIFVYLWSPVLMNLAKEVPMEDIANTWGLDRRGDPAFGLIFMVFMSACVLGGIIAPFLRQGATELLTPILDPHSKNTEASRGAVRPMAVEFLSSSCYFLAACMLLVPCVVSGPNGFSQSLLAFSLYELIVGIVSPCEGVIRSIYFPAHARASVWTLPSLLVNGAVSLAVFGTQFISLLNVCLIVVSLMVTASLLQASLITATEWGTVKTHVRNTPRLARSLSLKLLQHANTHVRKTPHYVRSASMSVIETAIAPPKQLVRRLSDLVSSSVSDTTQDLDATTTTITNKEDYKDKVD